MSDTLSTTKFYIRFREGVPESELHDHAKRGFWTLNVETGSYDWIDAIDDLPDLGPDVGLAGYVGDVHRALTHLGKPIPRHDDYPEPLTEFLGRTIRTGTLGDVRATTTQVFVKPTALKAFSGFLWLGNGDAECRRRVVTHSDDTPVFIADPVHFVAEFRVFLLYGKIVDVRRYKGDWAIAPDRGTIEAGARAMKKTGPHAYCMDWGVTDDGRTLLVESNEGYSFGHYGLPPATYARMLAVRWKQMVSEPGGTP